MVICLDTLGRCWAYSRDWNKEKWIDAISRSTGKPKVKYCGDQYVLKFTHVVDNDTTVHDVFTYTIAFSPSVLIKCSICPYHQTVTRTP